jgi:hypothetical protein
MTDQDAFLVGACAVALAAIVFWPDDSDAAPAVAPPRPSPPPPPRPALPPPPLPPPPPASSVTTRPPPASSEPAPAPATVPASSAPVPASSAPVEEPVEEPVIEMPPEIIEREKPELLIGYVETDETRALGRVIHSEAGSQTLGERVAVAWVARNRAAAQGTTIAKLMCSPCGRQGKARPMSTRLAPREEDLQIARQVLAAPRSADPTGGADHAFEPVLQDKLHAAGRPGYTKSAADVRARWTRTRIYYGNAGRWELYGPKRG